MLPVARFHLRDLYETTVEFFALRSPADSETHCPRACPCRSQGASAAASSLYAMRRDADSAKSDLHRSQLDLARLDERCKLLERTLAETRDALRARERDLDLLRRRPRSQDFPRLRPRSSSSLPLPYPSSARPDVPPTLADEARAQARSTETFLTKSDLWSGAQVIQAVQDLNSEILQFAASAVELCTFAKHRPPLPKLAQTQTDVASRLGQSLTRTLAARDHSQDPMLVQIALQGCISYCISRALSSFCIGYQSKANITLTQLYTHMFQSEPQPTSSRWRALAHKHIHELHPELADYAVNEMTETIFRWSFDLFLISGSTSPHATPSSREVFRTRFASQVKRISKSACRIAQIIREEIMSTNFEVVGADSGRAFDAQEMVDAFEDYGAPKGTVLCTTELGLRCSTRKACTESSDESQEETVERRLLLRPKVILESAVDMLDQR